jgi:hypothetical protein
MEYFADVRAPGPIRHDQAAYTIFITSSPDRLKQIGVAIQVGFMEDGVALWRLRIDGDQIPGLWTIMDRRFVPDDAPLPTP